MTKKFVIEDSFWSIFPEAKIGIVVAYDIDNSVKAGVNYEALLMTGMNEARHHLGEEVFSKNSVVAVWREAYQQFKTKKGARSSIEAMLKRVESGRGIGSINPLVDIYNLISLKYGMPCGGEDIDTFEGTVKLTKAIGDEPFLVLGNEENAPPHPDEIVYKDDLGAICRCWNWRESVRTMLTEETTNAFLCLELIQAERRIEFSQALLELKMLVEAYLGGQAKLHILDKNNKSIRF